MKSLNRKCKKMIYKLHRVFSPKSNAFLYSHGYLDEMKFNNCVIIPKKDILHMTSINEINNKEHLSTLSDWSSYEWVNGHQNAENIIELLKANQLKLSNHFKNPTISYLSNVHSSSPVSDLGISHNDVKGFANLLATIPEETKEINLILYSLGGYELGSRKIVEFFRQRFDTVNIMVPLMAHSAATMICLAADKIILTPEASLSPFDIQILSPVTEQYLSAIDMIEVVNGAKKSLNPLCIFSSRETYKGWDIENTRRVKRACRNGIKTTRQYPTYWLMKYMFKKFSSIDFAFAKYLIIPFWKRLYKDGRKANRIVSFFIDTGINFSHNEPIMFSDLEHSGLNIELASGDLLKLLRENYTLADVLFDRSSITKLFVSQDDYFVRYIANKSKGAEE